MEGGSPNAYVDKQILFQAVYSKKFKIFSDVLAKNNLMVKFCLRSLWIPPNRHYEHYVAKNASNPPESPKCDPSDSISLPMNATIYYHSSIRIPHGHVPHPF